MNKFNVYADSQLIRNGIEIKAQFFLGDLDVLCGSSKLAF
jgi:hypothetical protein